MLSELAEHLQDDSVAVLMEAGAEKLRYVAGWAAAVNAKGEVVEIGLHAIYDMAKQKFGDDVEITVAEY